MSYYEEHYEWGPEQTRCFSTFIDDLLTLGYKIPVAEYFREEADHIRKAKSEMWLAVVKARRS